MSDAKLMQDMSPSEQRDFFNTLRAAEDGLEAARDWISKQEAMASDTGDLGRLRSELADIEAKLKAVRDRRQAFRNNALSLKPPSAAVVEDMKRRAAEMDRLVASATAAKTVIDSASLLVNAFNGVLKT